MGTISAIDAREGGIVDFGESGPTLLIEVDVSGLGHRLALVRAAWGKFFAGHRLGRSRDREGVERLQQSGGNENTLV